MRGKTIAFLESRLADHVAELVARRGATAISAPALSEEPDIDPRAIARLIERCTGNPPAAFVFQTGVGTRALFATADALDATRALLDVLSRTVVVARGPKPTVVLKQRGVRIDRSAAEPFTTVEILAAMETIEVAGRTVVVQRYGDSNDTLEAGLVVRGATVVEVPVYRWALPQDAAPLLQLIDALDRGEVDAVAFTSASQVANLMTVAERAGRSQSLRDGLSRTLVASVGPVCSAALRDHGIRVDTQASPPKLGPLLDALTAALSGAEPRAGG